MRAPQFVTWLPKTPTLALVSLWSHLPSGGARPGSPIQWKDTERRGDVPSEIRSQKTVTPISLVLLSLVCLICMFWWSRLPGKELADGRQVAETLSPASWELSPANATWVALEEDLVPVKDDSGPHWQLPCGWVRDRGQTRWLRPPDPWPEDPLSYAMQPLDPHRLG